MLHVAKFMLHVANIKKQMVSYKSTAEEVSFKWSYKRTLSTDPKVRTTPYVFIIASGSEKAKGSRINSNEQDWSFSYCLINVSICFAYHRVPIGKCLMLIVYVPYLLN